MFWAQITLLIIHLFALGSISVKQGKMQKPIGPVDFWSVIVGFVLVLLAGGYDLVFGWPN